MRWYHSLSLRLLLLFWALLFTVASSGYVLALWFSTPITASPLEPSIERSLTPLLSDPQTVRSLAPGRLVAGDYRVVASYVERGSDPLKLDAVLATTHQRVLLKQLDATQAEQLPVKSLMLLGPFVLNHPELGEKRVLLSRPLTAAEQVDKAVNEQQAQQAQTYALLVGSGIIAVLLGIYLVKPLKRLTQATREIAEGSAEPELKRLPRRSDELGLLARALQTTAHDLAVSRDAQRRLLSDVSHELRSPLARMQVALMLSQDESDEGADNPHLSQLSRDVERLSAIIERILSLSRLENGLVALETSTIDTRALAETLAADLSYVDAAHGQRVQVLPLDGQGDWPTIESDPELLRLVLENLVRNALQYTDEQVELSCQKNSPDEFEIRVRDYGKGVEKEVLEKLFEPFYRGDPSRHHKAGVGLGMALSLRAAAVLGGHVSARNHSEGGLEVCVQLPLKCESEQSGSELNNA